jgi:exopolysaccharide biosynthesis protein
MKFFRRHLIFICLFVTTLVSTAGAFCEPIQINHENGIYHIILDGKKIEKNIKFVSSENLITNKEAHAKYNSILTINAGFFDPKNQKTISYIVTDRIISADPLFNENLMMNPILRQNLDKIVNRSEFRVIDCDGKYHYEIVPHKTPVDFSCSVETSAQGGPMILPELKLEEEFFIVKDTNGKITRESASVLEKTARTIIGLKKVNNSDEIHILVITNKNPKTIYEARDLCKKLGFDRAMAFDGGSSTSLDYKKSINEVSTSDSAGRMLKSFMIIEY